VELHPGPRTAGERGNLGGPEPRQEVHDEAEGMRELALPIPTAGDLRVRPRLAARQRDVCVVDVGRAVRQEVADDRRHRDGDVLDLPDPVRAVDQPARLLHDPHLVPRVAQHHVEAAVARQALDRPGIGRFDGERLLGQDVDARLERGPRLRRPERGGCGERNDVGAGGDHLPPVRGRVREREPVPQRGEQIGVATIDDPGLHLRPPEEARDVGEGRPSPGADDAETEPSLTGD
jgi:hypothetical protein